MTLDPLTIQHLKGLRTDTLVAIRTGIRTQNHRYPDALDDALVEEIDRILGERS